MTLLACCDIGGGTAAPVGIGIECRAALAAAPRTAAA